MEEKEVQSPVNAPAENPSSTLGDDILKILGERTKNPGEAFVLLQQLSIFVWDQYKVDWSQGEGAPDAGGRKQRLLDYISQMVDVFKAEEPAA